MPHNLAYCLHEFAVEGKRLGRHVWHDLRSVAYAVEEIVAPLKTVEWTRRAPVLDQGDLGACTGNALAGVLGTDSAAGRGDPTVGEELAVRLYRLATHLDRFPGSYPPDDTGSTGLAVCKAGTKLGLLAEYRHAFSLHGALVALQHGPVITGVPWYSSFDTPSPDGLVTITEDAWVRGGHEFEVIGVDVEAKTVQAVNSWGTGWGDKGRFRLSWDTWRALLGQHGDVTVPVRV